MGGHHGPLGASGLQQQELSLEEELAGVLSALLSDSRTAKDAVEEVAAICMRRAEALR